MVTLRNNSSRRSGESYGGMGRAVIAKEGSSVIFQIRLKAGQTRLQTWFWSEGEDDVATHVSGAYYVYVQRFYPGTGHYYV